MSVARSFLLLSAGIVAGGLSMMTLEGEIDWLRWVRGPRLSNPLPPPVIAQAPSLPEPVAAPPKQTSPPVPETVIVNVNQPTASIPIGKPAWQGGGRQLPITRELQGELQRVGCYGGAIDGYWSPLAQRSAKAFVEGVNAHLPVGEPDVALLALVRATRSTVCAKPCPPETTARRRQCLQAGTSHAGQHGHLAHQTDTDGRSADRFRASGADAGRCRARSRRRSPDAHAADAAAAEAEGGAAEAGPEPLRRRDLRSPQPVALLI